MTLDHERERHISPLELLVQGGLTVCWFILAVQRVPTYIYSTLCRG